MHHARAAGSAPRARGTRGRGAAGVVPTRVSPACAGNTRRAPGAFRAGHRVSPACAGNTLRATAKSICVSGSAPRARGTLAILQYAFLFHRVSPACAGNTGRLLAFHGYYSGQPRVRGEHSANSSSVALTVGSAPRARGTRGKGGEGAGGDRVSPACAGNTKSGVHPGQSPPGQPRVRGEHITDGDGVALVDRVSPACAGNTPRIPLHIAGIPGQPRVRGEHSSRLGGVAEYIRVSPACAGNTR